ncbi:MULTISPECIES: hypothetical protein [unclassified Clostridium]|uniref:hypothetical protein n=1 Tax=unclassified Clostridium TaxID=2614128 RepID=UPI0025C15E95|nr:MULTISPECIES: hypothetical protein [unclassified Clostridium]
MHDKRQLKLINKLFNIEKTYDINSEEEAILEGELLELFEEEMPDEDFRSNVMELIDKEDVQFKNKKLKKNKKSLIAVCAVIIALIIILPYNKVIVDAIEQWVRSITITNDGISQTFKNVEDIEAWKESCKEIKVSEYEKIKRIRPICSKEYINANLKGAEGFFDSKGAKEYLKNESIIQLYNLGDLELDKMIYYDYNDSKFFQYFFSNAYRNDGSEDYGDINVIIQKYDKGPVNNTICYEGNSKFKKVKVLSYEGAFQDGTFEYENCPYDYKSIIIPIPEEGVEIRLRFDNYLSKNLDKNLEDEVIKMMEQIIREIKRNKNLKVVTDKKYNTVKEGEKYIKEQSIIKLHELLGVQLDSMEYKKYDNKENFSYLYIDKNLETASSKSINNISVDITKYNKDNSGNISVPISDFEKVNILSYDGIFMTPFDDGECLELYMPDKKIKIHLSSTNDMKKEDAIKAMETIIRDINK